MKFVELEHPKAGTCRVPETTAENLVRHGGWKRAGTPKAPTRKAKSSTTPTKSSTQSSTSPPDPDIPGDGEEDPES